jgi:hypothetical protein
LIINRVRFKKPLAEKIHIQRGREGKGELRKP